MIFASLVSLSGLAGLRPKLAFYFIGQLKAGASNRISLMGLTHQQYDWALIESLWDVINSKLFWKHLECSEIIGIRGIVFCHNFHSR